MILDSDTSRSSSPWTEGHVPYKRLVPFGATLSPTAAPTLLGVSQSELPWASIVTYVPVRPLHGLEREFGFISILMNLSRLRDGWAGAGSKAISKNVLADIGALAPLMPPNASKPKVEVDADGEEVVFSWTSPDFRDRFSLTLRGTGRVVGAVVSPTNGESGVWRYLVSDRDLARKLADAIHLMS